MEHEVFNDPLDGRVGGVWVVEAIDYESEGEVYRTEFCGFDAEAMAKEYCEWKNATG